MSAVQDPPTATEVLDCETCATSNPAEAHFCKACGSALAPHPACKKCSVEVPAGSTFCPGCGVRLVGARPMPEVPVPSVETEPSAVKAAAAALPVPPRATSNVGSNVVLFVAILMVMLVVIYNMNKDAKVEISPFAGGPAPGRTADAPADAPAEAAPAAVAADPVTGVVSIAEGLTAPSGTLFVILRNEGVKRGPPLAVKKIVNPTFPQSFTLGPADVMIKGLPFTGPFEIQARVDADGNAMTKAAGDLTTSAAIAGLRPGSQVKIVVDTRL